MGEIMKCMAAELGHGDLRGMGMVIMMTVSFYMIGFAYTPTFGKEVLKLSAIDIAWPSPCVSACRI